MLTHDSFDMREPFPDVLSSSCSQVCLGDKFINLAYPLSSSMGIQSEDILAHVGRLLGPFVTCKILFLMCVFV